MHHQLNRVDVSKRKLYIENKLREYEREGEVSSMFEERLRECGWEEEMMNYCKSIIRKEGLDHVKVEELEEKMMVKGKNIVPMGVREEILSNIVGLLTEDGLLSKEKKYKQDVSPY